MDKLDLILSKIESLDKKVSDIDVKVNNIDVKVNNMDVKMNRMNEKINAMDTDIKVIKLTLENEVRTNIMRVAEGHLDLSRNLKDAVKSNNEFEMLTIKVNMLESDVRELKRKIS